MDKVPFFSGSDDKDITMQDEPLATQTLDEQQDENQTLSDTEPKSGLFFADSDEEGQTYESSFVTPQKRHVSSQEVDDEDEDIEIPSFEELPKASSPTSTSPARQSSPAPSITIVNSPPAKKQKLSPLPPVHVQSHAISMYIGSFIVGNAWSTVKGPGYIKNGENFMVERDDQDEGPFKSKKGSKPEKGKGKQLSIMTMMNPQPQKLVKKKVNTVVRLTNMRGFEFGRLPTDVATWVSRLLDLGIVEFKKNTMIECPERLHSGADLIISLSIYLRASAFQTLSTSAQSNKQSKQPVKTMINEGEETLEEQIFRERKASLLKLFDVIGLKPRIGANLPRDRAPNHPDKLEAWAKKHVGSDEPIKKIFKTEVVGDGEEVEVEEGEDLSETELDLIYRKAQKHDQAMDEMEPSNTFIMTLRGYQKQALLWMQSLESGTSSAREPVSMHPLWSEYAFPCEPVDGMIDLTADEQPFYFNPYSGELSLEFPRAERRFKGGILADVGMGKTIMISALIHTNRDPEPIEDARIAEKGSGKRRQLKLNNAFRPIAKQCSKSTKGPSATLIVAPTSLLNQWNEEIHRSSQPGTVRVVVWHGQNRHDLNAAVEEDDENDKSLRVVITSYGVLASEHAKGEKSSSQLSPVFQIEWLRVVLDEAHHCKSRLSKTARAVYALQARRRWAVTGTPIVNKLEDLYSLLKFLDFAPWSSYPFFRSFITLPFLDRDPKAIEIVQVILESVLLRREKNMRDSDGKRIVELPAKEVVIEDLEFSPLERRIYDSIYTDAKKNFDQLNAKGLVGKNYTHILAMLMRLRRAVLHPNLVLSPKSEDSPPPQDEKLDIDAMIKQFAQDGTSVSNREGTFAEGVLNNLADIDDAECPICLDVMQSPMIIPACMHQCCKDCIVCYLTSCEDRGEEPRCPTCSRGPLKESDLLEVVRSKKKRDEEAPATSQNSAQEVILRRNDFQSSTKLDALILNLRRLRDQDPCFRAVVFSQFTSFLDLIEVVLQRERFDFYRFDGSMDVKKRNEAISEFKANSRKPKVLIVSLKAGGVGLNLTVANHVFMMDCWWNAATENQAIDRVHRIGQEKTVYVKHFIISDTIEGRILQVQKRKTAIVKEAFRGKGISGADSESMENLKIMFGEN